MSRSWDHWAAPAHGKNAVWPCALCRRTQAGGWGRPLGPCDAVREIGCALRRVAPFFLGWATDVDCLYLPLTPLAHFFAPLVHTYPRPHPLFGPDTSSYPCTSAHKSPDLHQAPSDNRKDLPLYRRILLPPPFSPPRTLHNERSDLLGRHSTWAGSISSSAWR